MPIEEQIADEVTSASGATGRFRDDVRRAALEAIRQRRVSELQCDQRGKQGNKLGKAISVTSRGLTVASTAASAGVLGSGAFSGALAAGPGAVFLAPIALFLGFRAQHQRAIAIEQATLCDAEVEFNEVLRQADQGFQDGSLTRAQALGAIQQEFERFRAGIASIRKTCNAACNVEAQAMANVMIRERLDYPAPSVLSPTNVVVVGGTILLALLLTKIL